MDIKEKIRTTNWHVFHKRRRSPWLQLLIVGAGIRNEGVPFDHRVRYFGVFFDHVAVDKVERAV